MYKDQSVRPFLRWAGSKRKLVPNIARYWHDQFDRYVEPFAGSAALYFALAPKNALLADINKELIQTFVAVRDHCDDVIRLLSPLPPSSKETYLVLRALRSEDLSEIEVATRFIYLNRHCFNGLYRTNADGRFNVPFSAIKTGKVPSPDELRACAQLLAGASIQHATFMETIAQARKGDFVYLDPPYIDSNARVFSEYGALCFDHAQLSSLRIAIGDLNERGVKFVLSFNESKEGRFLADGFDLETVYVGRSIASKSMHRRLAKELLITNI